MPSTAFVTARKTTSQRGPEVWRSRSPNATSETSVAWIAATVAKAIPYPSSRSSFAIGIAIRRSSVPVVRSRSIVIEVIKNIAMNGKSPSSGTPILSKTPGLSMNMYFRSVTSATGTIIRSAIVRGSRRS